MSFFLIREFFVIYLFLFYAYFYFAIDEEFVVFIVLALWTIFIIIFYLKTISALFYDSMEILSSEFFFFHDKKNMILSIFRDQYYDFIILNKMLYTFFNLFQISLNQSINNKIVMLYNTSNFYLSDSLNFFKSYFKISLYLFFYSVFAHFNNILNLLLFEINECFEIFARQYNILRLRYEGENLKKMYLKHYSENSVVIILPYLVSTDNSSYDFNVNILYKTLINKQIVNIENSVIFNQIDVLKKPSLVKVVERLNIKVYFNILFMYALLHEYSFVTLNE